MGENASFPYSTRFSEFALFAALASALLIVVPGPLDSEAFTVGREFGFQLFVSVAVLSLLISDLKFDVGWADVSLLTFLVLVWTSGFLAEVSAFAWRGIGLMTATVCMWLAVRASSPRFRHETLAPAVVFLGAGIAVVSWCEAIGWIHGLSDAGRAPGGLFGNRNRMAHVLALSLPSAFYLLAEKRSRVMTVMSFAAVSLIVGMLILSRCRAAWVGTVVGLVVLGVGWIAKTLTNDWPAARSVFFRNAAAVGAGVCLVSIAPTVLSWQTSHPYQESIRTISNISTGSGRARVNQQATTMRMVKDFPTLGVGPGNWQVAYGRYALPGDSSYRDERIVPTNRLPHGDWVGIAAEMGIFALGALLLFFTLTAFRLWRSAHECYGNEQREDRGRIAALATLSALAVMGLSDPVFLTPAPAALAITIAATWFPRVKPLTRVRVRAGTQFLWIAGAVLVLGRPLILAARQCYGDYLRRNALSELDLVAAARWNPADFTSRILLSRALVRRGRCDLAMPYAVQAYRLYPTSHAPLYVIGRCRSAAER